MVLSMQRGHQVVNPGEIVMFGHRFPIDGQVNRKAVSSLPPKITQGDYSRSDRVVESEWVLSDFSGGLGIINARSGRDEDRFAIGDLETRYRHATLGPEVVTTNRGTITGPVDRFIDFNDRMYAIQGSDIRKWDEATGSWTDPDPLRNMSGTYRDAAVYKGELFVLSSDALHKVDLATGNFLRKPQYGGYALCVFDDKMWWLDNSNTLYWSDDPYGDSIDLSPPGTWNAAGKLLLPPGFCRQLIVYFDQTNQPALHAVTKIGLWGYDFETQRFFETPLKHPYVEAAGKGAAVWQSALFVPVGSSIYRYTGDVVRMVGPDKDEGLPPALQGNVRQVVAGHGFYYCVIEGNVAQEPADKLILPESAAVVPRPAFTPAVTNGGVLSSPGEAWHMHTQLNDTTMGDAYCASTDGGKFRLWFSDAEGVYYITQPTSLHNPLRNPYRTYQKSGYLETYWQDHGWAEIDKLALSVDVEAAGCDESNTIDIYAGWDGAESWEHVGQVNAAGRTVFRIGGEAGKRYRKARLRLVFTRDPADALATPVLYSLSFGFLRLPKTLRGWEFSLVLTDPHCRETVGKTAAECIAILEELEETKRRGQFFYVRGYGNVVNRPSVVMEGFVATETTGDTLNGRYSVSLLEVDT